MDGKTEAQLCPFRFPALIVLSDNLVSIHTISAVLINVIAAKTILSRKFYKNILQKILHWQLKVQITKLDDFKEAFNSGYAIFLGNAEFLVVEIILDALVKSRQTALFENLQSTNSCTYKHKNG
jgi:hypothetical protein